MEEKTSFLFITANVGSIFEDPDVMLNLWIQEFLQTVTRLNAKFIALHCQEVGGKNYETRMQHVKNFVQMLLSSNELLLYDKAEIFLDEDFSCAENFTALGNFYFIHQTITDASIWDFEDLKFQNLYGKNVHAGNIEKIPVKEKSKFPQNFFPECKWSRKGYLRTRWAINGTIFDLVNIHLFHDASNFVAMQAFPSVYTVTRQKALQYTLNRFYNYEGGSAPFFLFGDFNFRTDTRGVIKKLTTGLNEYKNNESNADSKVEYKDDTSEVIITIGKKEFNHADHQNVFINDAGEWLKEFDREMESFKDQLFEFPIQFVPSYPFEENSVSGKSYMKTRCPAWCDRVLLSTSAKQLISEDINRHFEYGMIGKESCMGDHKPVFLFVDLLNGAGIIQTKLPIRRVCSACKLNNNALCDALNESPSFALKSHFSCSARNDATPVNLPCSCCKKYHRNLSRCYETNVSVMSTVTELSDRVSDDHDTDGDTYYLDNAIPTVSNSSSIDNANFNAPNHPSDRETDADNGAGKSKSKFADDNLSLSRFYEIFTSKNFSNRSFDENVAMRSNSAHTVVESSWRSKTCTCLQDTAWRMRSVSSSSRTSSWNSDGRIRLKSDPNLKTSLPRIQSHHSSSDEEWFEEVEEQERQKNEEKVINVAEEIEEYIEFDAVPAGSDFRGSISIPLTSRISHEKSRKNKYFLFCIPRTWKKSSNEEGMSKCKLKKNRYFKFVSSKSRKCKWCCSL